jgi:sodium/hydrogen exchanger 8
MHDNDTSAVPTEDQDEFDMVNSIILTSSLLVLITIGHLINTHRIKNLPESGAAMALGFLVGIVVRIFRLKQEEQLLDPSGRFGAFFFFVLLPPIIFEAGFSLQTHIFVDNLGAILAFAVLGTVISTWITSMGMWMAAHTGIFGLEMSDRLAITCHLFGALISATDPVATMALFSSTRFRADPLLHSLMNGESVLNDAVALVLFITLSHHLDADEVPELISFTILGHFFLVLLGSILIGIGAGALCSWCFSKSRSLSRFPDCEISAILLGAYLTYTFTQLMGLSGIVALFFFGIVLSHYNWYNLSESSKVASKVAFGTLAKLAEACVFIYLGVVAALSLGRFHWNIGLVLFALLTIITARAMHIFPIAAVLNNCGRERKITGNMTIVMWASGLRGAIAFAMSLRIPCAAEGLRRGSAECRNSDLFVTTTISIVVVTTLAIGSSMEAIATMLGVIEPIDQASLAEPLAGSGASDGCLSSVPPGADVMLTSMRSTRSASQGFMPLPSITPPGHGSPGGHAPPEHGGGPEPPSRVPSMYGIARSLYTQRFAARGQVYQAFARFDLNVLQPTFGGPCRLRLGAASIREVGDYDMPSLPGYGEHEGFTRLLAPPEEEFESLNPQMCRSVIFE